MCCGAHRWRSRGISFLPCPYFNTEAGAKIEIEKYSVWNEKKAVPIGFTKVALGKFIDQNDEVMYFTR